MGKHLGLPHTLIQECNNIVKPGHVFEHVFMCVCVCLHVCLYTYMSESPSMYCIYLSPL